MHHIDGSRGEGGGQVLRTSLSLSALTGKPFRLTKVRANRAKPGLRPQHLTAVRAVGAVCSAETVGASLNSTTLEFHPQTAPLGGSYRFDVSEASKGGSAGSVSLIAQALLWPLLFANLKSNVTLLGGTHVPFSPPAHYLAETAKPSFAQLGADFSLDLVAWGWYPAGGGEMRLAVEPLNEMCALSLMRNESKEVHGLAAVTNLPAHIPQRMAGRARNLLTDLDLHPSITAVRDKGRAPGAGMMLWLPGAGFSSLGRRGLPAESVAEAAVKELMAFLDSRMAVDRYLTDQLLLPLSLAKGQSSYTSEKLTLHTLTNIDLLRQWLDVEIHVEGNLNEPGEITINGIGFKAK